MIRVITLLLLLSFIYSCDPGYSIILSNNANEKQEVKVIGKYHTLINDSVKTTDISGSSFFSEKNKFTNIPITGKDTTENSYTFFLDQGQRALIGYGMGVPNMKQKMIIVNNDTIDFRKDNRVTRKQEFLSTTLLVDTK
ncbi:MAG: hypothetical protein QM791_03825 [Ferruginibacter sp.]